MVKSGLYLILLLIGLVAAFALGYARHDVKSSAARRILYYVDPMHPSYRSDKPGIAPDCGMDLVPVYADEAGKAIVTDREIAVGGGEAEISATSQQLYGIRLTKAVRDGGNGSIQVFARVIPDETRIYRVNFGTEGYVKETHGDAVGNYVAKNQRLATVYSPDFLAVAGGYLAAQERDQVAPSAPSGNFVANSSLEAASVQARGDRLRNLGMSDAQLNEITRTRKLPEDVYIVSPTDGFILTRSISPGLRFERETDLYTIADLSHVWIVAEVFGRDAQAFHPGMEATATLTDSDQSFRTRVSDVLPEVDSATRTLKVRLEADNPGYKLRPNMFVTVAVPISLPYGVTVPASAVLDSGSSKRVFVQTSFGTFQSRTVETGWQLGERVQIVKGLQAGETIVSSGTFLVDSESKLQATGKASLPTSEASSMSHDMNHAMN